MSAVENMLNLLIGKENTDKIIAHPNLHVLSLPEPMIHDLREGTIMVVPVGVLCDLCDKPARVAFCLCETETITDSEGFTITTKRREDDHDCGMRRHGEDCACQKVTVSGGPDAYKGVEGKWTTDHRGMRIPRPDITP